MLPKTIPDVDLAFPSSVDTLLPKWDEIPKEFKSFHGEWVELVEKWFFYGLEGCEFVVKDGISEEVALRHLSAIMRSFEPKHEHKIAGVAYLMSQWCEFPAS